MTKQPSVSTRFLTSCLLEVRFYRIERLPALLLVWTGSRSIRFDLSRSVSSDRVVRAVGRGGACDILRLFVCLLLAIRVTESRRSSFAELRCLVVGIHFAVSPHLLEFTLLAFFLRFLFLFLGFLLFLLGFVEKMHHCEDLSGSHPQSLSNLLAVRIVLFVEPGGTTVFVAVNGVPDCGDLVDVDVSARSVDGEHAAFMLHSVINPFVEYLP